MLQMTSDAMRELARHVTDISVERVEGLPGERAWEGDFKDALAQLTPQYGRQRFQSDEPQAGSSDGGRNTGGPQRVRSAPDRRAGSDTVTLHATTRHPVLQRSRASPIVTPDCRGAKRELPLLQRVPTVSFD